MNNIVVWSSASWVPTWYALGSEGTKQLRSTNNIAALQENKNQHNKIPQTEKIWTNLSITGHFRDVDFGRTQKHKFGKIESMPIATLLQARPSKEAEQSLLRF